MGPAQAGQCDTAVEGSVTAGGNLYLDAGDELQVPPVRFCLRGLKALRKHRNSCASVQSAWEYS